MELDPREAAALRREELRNIFAAHVMNGILAGRLGELASMPMEGTAAYAFQLADEMLKHVRGLG